MKTSTLSVFAIILLLFPVSCVERYWPELGDKYEKALVVDGTISSNPGPYTVRLSQSSNVAYPKLYPYTGCLVSIVEEGGPTEILSEQEPGIYTTSSTGMTGEVGKRYKIRINTPNERTYESTFEKLEAPVGLASVYAEHEYKESEELPYQLEGYQFYLDTELATKDSNYFMWSMETTYKYQADFLIRNIYTYRNLSVFPQPDSFYTCWQTKAIPELFTYETEQLSSPVIKGMPLHFVSTEARELSIRYSLKITQHTITADKSQRATAFEPVKANSGYNYKGGLAYYENITDVSTDFFMRFLHKGTYVLEYPLYLTQKGSFSNGIATLQSMYAPEFGAHSSGLRISVE